MNLPLDWAGARVVGFFTLLQGVSYTTLLTAVLCTGYSTMPRTVQRLCTSSELVRQVKETQALLHDQRVKRVNPLPKEGKDSWQSTVFINIIDRTNAELVSWG